MSFDVVFATTQILPPDETFILADAANGDLVFIYGFSWSHDQFWNWLPRSLSNCTTELISLWNDSCAVMRISDVTGVVEMSIDSEYIEYVFFTIAMYRNVGGFVVPYFYLAGYSPMGPIQFGTQPLHNYHAVLVHVADEEPAVSGPAGLVQLTHGSVSDVSSDLEVTFTVDLSIWEFPATNGWIPEIYVNGSGYLTLLDDPFPVLPTDPGNPAPIGASRFPIR